MTTRPKLMGPPLSNESDDDVVGNRTAGDHGRSEVWNLSNRQWLEQLNSGTERVSQRTRMFAAHKKNCGKH